MTNEKNCILSSVCKLAGDKAACNDRCSAFIAMHGKSRKGGRLSSANVPIDYRYTTVQTSHISDEQADAYKKIRAYVKTFIRQFEQSDDHSSGTEKRIKSLYLFSPTPGNGKTTTASAILNEYLISHFIGSLKRDRQPLQRPCYFLDVNEWQTEYNAFNRKNIPDSIGQPAAERYYRQMELAKKTPFVVMDDIGVRDFTEGFRADLHSVISYRVSNRLPTVYTSNVPMSELPEVFNENPPRLYDRLRDLCVAIEFVGESKRGLRK